MRVLLTRPEPDSATLGCALTDMGIESINAPLLEIIFEDGPDLNLDGVQALLFTSANGVRAFAGRSNTRDILAMAVGDATARELGTHGFKNVKSAAGDVETLAALVIDNLKNNDGKLLHIAGSRVAGDLEGMLSKAGFKYSRSVLYRAETPDMLPANAINAIEQQSIDGILFYSPRTAKTFANLATRARVDKKLSNITAYCLSVRVSDQIMGLSWREIKVATTPEQPALLALLEG
ncbi:MAG: uroporphyrinogen-III synthase [Rhodospirillaceae bacterium]|nr:uroporphyrinogen-III synthase [Rhodospirillaceae bacterium]